MSNIWKFTYSQLKLTKNSNAFGRYLRANITAIAVKHSPQTTVSVMVYPLPCSLNTVWTRILLTLQLLSPTYT